MVCQNAIFDLVCCKLTVIVSKFNIHFTFYLSVKATFLQTFDFQIPSPHSKNHNNLMRHCNKKFSNSSNYDINFSF